MRSSYRIGRWINRSLGQGACFVIAGTLLTATTLGGESAPTARQPGESATPQPQLKWELNKLEQQGDDCVIWTVLDNRLDTGFKSLKLDLVLFGSDGLIQRRLALDLAPLATSKTTVKVFKIPTIRCDLLGRILVNDVVACAGETGPLDDCLDRIRVSSLAKVELIR